VDVVTAIFIVMPRNRLPLIVLSGAGTLVLVLALLIFYIQEKGVIGVGAAPLSDDLAATWFHESVTHSVDYRLGIIVFLLGKPGWTDASHDWTSGKGSPAFSTFVINGRRLHIEYSRESGEWNVLDTAGSVEEGNVLVVKGCGTETQKVTHTELIDLTLPYNADPVAEVLARSKTLRNVLDQK